jgi:alanyl-tRNA synthetase
VDEVTLPSGDTDVLYPDGAVTSESRVLHVEPTPDGRLAVLLDRTAFHPVDAVWPDQGPDHGVLLVRGDEVPVLDAVVGATQGEQLLLGGDVPVRTGAEGWYFVVVHLVPSGTAIEEGDAVRVVVDEDHRTALSAAHTACHLAALALDRALAGAWSKDPGSDPLGAPAFDQLAIERSRIHPFHSEDVYRIGRSLRKKGFSPAALDDPGSVERRADEELARWVASGAPVRIEREETGLGARRSWVCELPDGTASIPCGGTHVASLAELHGVRVRLQRKDVSGGLELTMTTVVR